MRTDLAELASYAVEKGMRAVISTNGTLITPAAARQLKMIGLSYVGISLDGMEQVNDRFRGVRGLSPKPWTGLPPARKRGSRSACASP